MEDMPDQEGHKHGQESYCQVTQHRLFNRCFSELGTDIPVKSKVRATTTTVTGIR